MSMVNHLTPLSPARIATTSEAMCCDFATWEKPAPVTPPRDPIRLTTLPQADLPQDHGILRAGAQRNQTYVPGSGTVDA